MEDMVKNEKRIWDCPYCHSQFAAVQPCRSLHIHLCRKTASCWELWETECEYDPQHILPQIELGLHYQFCHPDNTTSTQSLSHTPPILADMEKQNCNTSSSNLYDNRDDKFNEEDHTVKFALSPELTTIPPYPYNTIVVQEKVRLFISKEKLKKRGGHLFNIYNNSMREGISGETTLIGKTLKQIGTLLSWIGQLQLPNRIYGSNIENDRFLHSRDTLMLLEQDYETLHVHCLCHHTIQYHIYRKLAIQAHKDTIPPSNMPIKAPPLDPQLAAEAAKNVPPHNFPSSSTSSSNPLNSFPSHDKYKHTNIDKIIGYPPSAIDHRANYARSSTHKNPMIGMAQTQFSTLPNKEDTTTNKKDNVTDDNQNKSTLHKPGSSTTINTTSSNKTTTDNEVITSVANAAATTTTNKATAVTEIVEKEKTQDDTLPKALPTTSTADITMDRTKYKKKNAAVGNSFKDTSKDPNSSKMGRTRSETRAVISAINKSI